MKLNIKNPYLGKGKFLWKHNDDSDLGGDEDKFSKKGLSYPERKSSGKYGLPGSTLLDRDTKEASVKATKAYLKERGIEV